MQTESRRRSLGAHERTEHRMDAVRCPRCKSHRESKLRACHGRLTGDALLREVLPYRVGGRSCSLCNLMRSIWSTDEENLAYRASDR